MRPPPEQAPMKLTRRNDWVPFLADLPIFAGVSKRHLHRIARHATTRRFVPLTRIVREGEPARTFYVVLDGQVSVTRKGRRLARLGAGEAFGEMALLTDSPRSSSIVADTDVLTMCLSRTNFNKVLKDEPAVSRALLKTLAKRLHASERSPSH
jgi:CRP-like cAMP-binding protein